MQRRAQYGFRILIPAADAVWILEEKLNLSCITVVFQVQHQPRLIINLSGKTDEVSPSVNDIKDRDVDPALMQSANNPTGDLIGRFRQGTFPGV